MHRAQFYIDASISIIIFVVVHAMVFYLAYRSVLDKESILHPGSEGLVIFSTILTVCFVWALVLAYRVTEIGETVVLSSVFGRKKIVKTKNIDSIISILKYVFYLKFDDGNNCLLLNHMDGGSKLEIAWKDRNV